MGSRPSRSPLWPRRLAVVLCCVLSVTAPFDESTITGVITPELCPVSAGKTSAEPRDAANEEEILFQGSCPGKLRRNERRLVRLLAVADPPPAAPLRARPATRDSGRPGSEHASRNGCGCPQLC